MMTVMITTLGGDLRPGRVRNTVIAVPVAGARASRACAVLTNVCYFPSWSGPILGKKLDGCR
jgi:hypothetical protein